MNQQKQPPEAPASQPHPPGSSCPDLPKTEPPKYDGPEPCKPDPTCDCGATPAETSNCLEKMITAQAVELTAADRAKVFKADLEVLLTKAKAAAAEYTQSKFTDLLDRWKKQDEKIAELLGKIDCTVKCWRCVIECHICPLIHDMRLAEGWLYGDGTQYDEVHNLYDEQYCRQRDRDAKQRRLERIRNVLAAWEKPAQTIDKALVDDLKLIRDVETWLGSDPAKAVYTLFLKLVPMHLAIAPPAGDQNKTLIDKKYTVFCICDPPPAPDDCCGPDVGESSIRQRLTGPQAYLIDPNDYFTVICCLVQKRYEPAKKALAEAEGALQEVEDRIKRYKAQIEDGLKTFEKNAKAALPSVIDCCTYRKEPKSEQAR